MKRIVVGVFAVALLLSAPRIVSAQARTLASEMRVETGVVEALDPATRSVTVKKSDGTVVTTVAGPDVKRFEEIKVGDKVTARFYENLVIRLKAPGEAEVDSKVKDATSAVSTLPGGTKAKQKTLTVTITAVDPATPSISFTGPNGWKYTSKVQDPTAIGKVKVGDKVDMVWTEAMLVSLERPK